MVYWGYHLVLSVWGWYWSCLGCRMFWWCTCCTNTFIRINSHYISVFIRAFSCEYITFQWSYFFNFILRFISISSLISAWNLNFLPILMKLFVNIQGSSFFLWYRSHLSYLRHINNCLILFFIIFQLNSTIHIFNTRLLHHNKLSFLNLIN